MYLFIFYSERAGHARELVQQINLEEWQGIVIVSGDGLIFEVSLFLKSISLIFYF